VRFEMRSVPVLRHVRCVWWLCAEIKSCRHSLYRHCGVCFRLILFYLRKVTDIIPDSIPGAGFVDDAAIISAVFENYRQPFLKHILARNARKTIEHDSGPDAET